MFAAPADPSSVKVPISRDMKSLITLKNTNAITAKKTFFTIYHLRQHMRFHQQGLEIDNLKCTNCNKEYKYVSSLMKHQKRCSEQLPIPQNDEGGSVQGQLEEDALSKKIFTSETKLDIFCFKKEEEKSTLNLKESISESNDPKFESNDEKIEISTESKDETQRLDPICDLARPAFNKNNSISSGLNPRGLVKVANSVNETILKMEESLRKTIFSNNLLLSMLDCNSKVTTFDENNVFNKHLEQFINFRKLVHEKFFSADQSK